MYKFLEKENQKEDEDLKKKFKQTSDLFENNTEIISKQLDR